MLINVQLVDHPSQMSVVVFPQRHEVNEAVLLSSKTGSTNNLIDSFEEVEPVTIALEV